MTTTMTEKRYQLIAAHHGEMNRLEKYSTDPDFPARYEAWETLQDQLHEAIHNAIEAAPERIRRKEKKLLHARRSCRDENDQYDLDMKWQAAWFSCMNRSPPKERQALGKAIEAVMEKIPGTRKINLSKQPQIL